MQVDPALNNILKTPKCYSHFVWITKASTSFWCLSHCLIPATQTWLYVSIPDRVLWYLFIGFNYISDRDFIGEVSQEKENNGLIRHNHCGFYAGEVMYWETWLRILGRWQRSGSGCIFCGFLVHSWCGLLVRHWPRSLEHRLTEAGDQHGISYKERLDKLGLFFLERQERKPTPFSIEGTVSNLKY